MNDALSNDEYEALNQISGNNHSARPSACISRNVKRLAGLKFVSYAKNGTLQITDKGQQTLFIRRCIDGLRAVLLDCSAELDADVLMFLGKKGHIAPCAQTGGQCVTTRGKESLIDIDLAMR